MDFVPLLHGANPTNKWQFAQFIQTPPLDVDDKTIVWDVAYKCDSSGSQWVSPGKIISIGELKDEQPLDLGFRAGDCPLKGKPWFGGLDHLIAQTEDTRTFGRLRSACKRRESSHRQSEECGQKRGLHRVTVAMFTALNKGRTFP